MGRIDPGVGPVAEAVVGAWSPTLARARYAQKARASCGCKTCENCAPRRTIAWNSEIMNVLAPERSAPDLRRLRCSIGTLIYSYNKGGLATLTTAPWVILPIGPPRL